MTLFAAFPDSTGGLAGLVSLATGLVLAFVAVLKFRPEADVALVGAATGFVGELRLELQATRERIAALEARESRREAEMQQLVSQLGRVEQERDAVTRRVSEQDTTITSQAQRIAELETQVGRLRRAP